MEKYNFWILFAGHSLCKHEGLFILSKTDHFYYVIGLALTAWMEVHCA